MPQCPKCKKEIDFLKNYAEGSTEEFIFRIDAKGNADYEYVDTIFCGSKDEYVCPECGEVIATDEKEAVKFLKP